MLMPCQLINIFGHVPPFITRPGTLCWTNNNTPEQHPKKHTHTLKGDLSLHATWQTEAYGGYKTGTGQAWLVIGLRSNKAGVNPSRKCAHVAQCTMCNRCQQAWRRHKYQAGGLIPGTLPNPASTFQLQLATFN